MKKEKPKKSGPAIFMYCIIALSAVIAAVCLTLYYTRIAQNPWCFWPGVVFFTIMYHLWLRIIMGNVNKLFNINYNMWWFKEKSFDKPICKFFRVKKWKGKALTYNPELFSLKNCSLHDIANTTCKVETDHLVNVLISLSTILFSLLWGWWWIFAISAFCAILFDMQFVLIQRHNRPRILRLIKRQKQI